MTYKIAVKYSLFCVNHILILYGVACLAMSTVMKLKSNPSASIIGGNREGNIVLLLLIGFLIIASSIFGIVGVYRERYWMLVTYTMILIVAIIIHISITTLYLIFNNTISELDESRIRQAYDKIETTSNVKDPRVHDMEIQYKCCGLTGPLDYTSGLPDSCCSKRQNCIIANSYTSGCLGTVVGRLESTRVTICGFLIGLAIIEFIGAAQAIWLMLDIGVPDLSDMV